MIPIIRIAESGPLFFECKPDGVFLGEALCRQAFEKPAKEPIDIAANEVELIAEYLQSQKMWVDRLALIQIHLKGLSLATAKTIYVQNKARYSAYSIKLRQPEKNNGQGAFQCICFGL